MDPPLVEMACPRATTAQAKNVMQPNILFTALFSRQKSKGGEEPPLGQRVGVARYLPNRNVTNRQYLVTDSELRTMEERKLIMKNRM